MKLNTLRARVVTWYVGLLAAALVVFGMALYFGVQGYLKTSLQRSLSGDASAIGANFLSFEEAKGPQWMDGEIAEAYAPELSGRFIRITRQDGTVLYQSGDTRDPHIDSSLVAKQHVATDAAFFREEAQDTGHLLLYGLPFVSSSGTRYLVETGASLALIERVLTSLLRILLLITPLILVAAALGGQFLMTLPLRPLVTLTQQAERIGTQNLGERLPVIATGDEMERLSLSLNRMISRLEDALSHNRRFSADVSHELRTPLTILRGELEQTLQLRGLPASVQDSVFSALEEIDRMARIVENLLAIARLDSGADCIDRQTIDLGELVSATTSQMHLLAEEKHIDLRVDAATAWITADAGRIKQVLVNLIDNALKYTPRDGEVCIITRSQGHSVLLEIADTGIGIPKDALPHVFDRFFRADKARSRVSGGTGLGLSIVNAIVNAHAGHITIDSIEGTGTTVRLYLPLSAAPNSPHLQHELAIHAR